MEEPMHVPPMPQHPPAPPPRPARARTRRLVAAGALLSAAALGTVFSVQAMASDGATPPGYERPDPAADGAPLEEGNFALGGGDKKAGARFAMVLMLKGGDLGKVKQGAADFSECMRDNGLKNFPDFEVSKAGDGVRLELTGSGKQFDPHSAAYEKAYKTCAPIMEKAGAPLPDRPAPPGKPGPPGRTGPEGPSLHEEFEDAGIPGTSEAT
ncbi:hypothetical protein [Streptomyces indicus]|uniref:Uncharacterized protein n=1 Tax=Streptomyces indicus TaxID=417292 RepID=A0A1G8VW36_9ACTN|nr:hypothetical protein [Streptomyces indicus]SDJ70298.1 hypothetical protein SAMN05421806_10283 [Streptomyces indicus]